MDKIIDQYAIAQRMHARMRWQTSYATRGSYHPKTPLLVGIVIVLSFMAFCWVCNGLAEGILR